MTKQAIFTVVTPLKVGEQQEVREILSSYGYLGACPRKDVFGFDKIKTLHFASMFIYDDIEDGWFLVFESNIDGAIEDYLDAFISLAKKLDNGKLLLKLYSHCTTFKGTDLASLKSYMLEHVIHPEAGYVSGVGLSREQIEKDAELYQLVDAKLGTQPKQLEGKDINAVILKAVEKSDSFKGGLASRGEDEQPSLSARIINSAKKPLIYTQFAVFGLYNLIKERAAVQDNQRPDLDLVAAQKQYEDIIPTNHMVSIVHLHTDFSRQIAKKIAFSLIRNRVILKFYKGWLGPINSIHFAHWAKLNEGRRLLFVSNFGGTWDSYLDDFTLKANTGLTLAWAHGVGFPKSWFMLKGGAAKGPEFIDWARRSMVPTLVWYKAYPAVSAPQIQRNRRLREALLELKSNPQDHEWLKIMGSSDGKNNGG